MASFALHDTEAQTVVIHRVPYKIEQTRRRILAAGLPRPLADRLLIGR
jgi:hypothetical protein